MAKHRMPPEWARARKNGVKGSFPAAFRRPVDGRGRAGIGPNKASGHKGGISRQGSKRG